MIQSTPNTSYLRYNAPSGAILPEQQQVALKDSLAQTKDSLTQSKDDNPAVKAAQDTTNDPKVLLGAVGIWGLLKIIVKPINKAISGKYENSLFGKIGAAGDKVSNVLHLNGLSETTTKIKEWAKTSKLTKYFAAPYKTTPKNTFAAAMAKGTLGELSQDTTSIIEACKKQGLDLSKMFPAEVDAAGNVIATDFAKINKILKNPIEHTDEIIKALRKAEPNEFVKFGGKIKLPFIKNKVQVPLFERKVYFSELANKLATVSKTGATSGLGKSMSKGVLRTLEGLTNGMAGGPAAMLIQAFCFAQATKAAIDAPKGEKLSTFMENVFQDLGYYLVGTTSINLMHHAGGNKYRGMSEATLKMYKDIIAHVNKQAAEGAIDKVGIKAAKEESKLLLKGVTEDAFKTYKNVVSAGNLDKKALKAAQKAALKSANIKFWERPLKFAGKILALGLDNFKPIMQQNDGKLVKLFKKVGSIGKGFPGGLGRFVLSMFVITPILIKPIVKLANLIFGRPTKSVLDKETDEKSEKVDTTPAPVKQNPQGSTNYLDIMTKNNQPTTTQTAQSKVQSPVNAAAPVAPDSIASQSVATDDALAAKKIKKETDSENNNSSQVNRTYVPSSTPTVFPDAPQDYSKVNELISRADAVERETLKNL